jgi:hypothetical protein
MPFFEAWPAFGITPRIRKKLLKINPTTIDRTLKEDRKKLSCRGISGTKPGKLLKKHIQVRTHYPWDDRKPGFFEIDTVHHCGERDAGEFADLRSDLTLDTTDVASGWVELRPLFNKAQKWVMEALQDIQPALPFPLLGIAAPSLSTGPSCPGAIPATSRLPATGPTRKTTTVSSSRKTSCAPS